MSVRSLAAGAVFAQAAGQAESEARTRRNPVRWIEEYVPTEAVILFVAVMAFAGSWSNLERWIAVIGVGVIVAALIVLDPWHQRPPAARKRGVVGFQTIAGVAGYFAWTLLDPHNPVDLDPRIGVGAGLGATCIFSTLAASRTGRWIVELAG